MYLYILEKLVVCKDYVMSDWLSVGSVCKYKGFDLILNPQYKGLGAERAFQVGQICVISA